MNNEIWEQVGEFLNRLRSEKISRETAVNVPGHKDLQIKVENMREKCEEMICRLPAEEKQMLLMWMEKLEDLKSLEEQKAYCQGYIDCILMLSGLGLLRQDLSPGKLMKWFE